MVSRGRGLATRQSQESLLSPRSLSHSLPSFNPSPRSLGESLDLSTAEETPRDDLAVSWPMSPRTVTTRVTEVDTPGVPFEAFSPRTPSPIAPQATSPDPSTLHHPELEQSSNLHNGEDVTSTITSTPRSTCADTGSPTNMSPPIQGEYEDMDLSLPIETRPLGTPDALSPRSTSPSTDTSTIVEHQEKGVEIYSHMTIQKGPAEYDLESSMKSMTSLASLGSLASPRTPTTTARTPRGGFVWRPVEPGYKAPEPPEPSHAVVIKSTVEVQQTVSEPQNNLKDSIPFMPKPIAILCFGMNIICPGLGTLVAGLSVLCCAKPRPCHSDKWNSVLINSWVALLQMVTTLLFLLGWIWSILWGAAFIQISKEESAKLAAAADAAAVENLAITASQSSVDDDTSHVSHRIRSSTTTATATTTISCEQEAASLEPQTMIILQEAPVVYSPGEMEAVVSPPVVSRPQRTLNPYNPRHQRALRRQNTEEELPPILLTPETLENIVIHNAPTMPGEAEAAVRGNAAHGPDGATTSNLGYDNPKAGPSRSTTLG